MALTIKQEKFARLYVELGNASEAYRRAYDAGGMSQEVIANEAWKLTQHHDVAIMVEKAKRQLSQKHAVTLESLAEELEEARALAVSCDQAAAAVSASMGKAKLYGLLIDKQETRNPDSKPVDKPDLSDLLKQAKQQGAISSDAGTEAAQPAAIEGKSAVISVH